jgi:hypothetical protein
VALSLTGLPFPMFVHVETAHTGGERNAKKTIAADGEITAQISPFDRLQLRKKSPAGAGLYSRPIAVESYEARFLRSGAAFFSSSRLF